MLTEEQARKKWCPMARMLESHAERTSYNVSHREEQVNYGRCIASGCMAWRWSRRSCTGEFAGYCGAFGKPGDA